MPDGARCRDDLRTFAAWASSAGAPGAFVRWVRAMEAARQSGGLQPGGSGQTRPGCVSVMTVHRSKGLEFPVVFVANTTHKFNQSDAVRPVLCHRSLGVGLMLRDPAPGQAATRPCPMRRWPGPSGPRPSARRCGFSMWP